MRDLRSFVFYGRDLLLRGDIYKYAIVKEIHGDVCMYYVVFRKNNTKYHQLGSEHVTLDEAYKAMICEEYDLITEEWDYESDLLDKE